MSAATHPRYRYDIATGRMVACGMPSPGVTRQQAQDALQQLAGFSAFTAGASAHLRETLQRFIDQHGRGPDLQQQA